MKIRFPKFIRIRQPFSRKMYWVNTALWWVYTMAWITTLFFVCFTWEASLFYKLGASLILILGAPAPTDLIKPYEQYKKEWSLHRS